VQVYTFLFTTEIHFAFLIKEQTHLLINDNRTLLTFINTLINKNLEKMELYKYHFMFKL